MTVFDQVGVGVDGTGRAMKADGYRRGGYNLTQVLDPYTVAHTTVYQRAALRRFLGYHRDERIVWRPDGKDGLWWVTARADDIERRILRMAGKRERGLRWTVSALARSLHANRSTVRRVIRSLQDRAIVTFDASRGRYSRMVLKVVASSNGHPYRTRDDHLNLSVYDPIPTGPNGRYWDRYSEAEQDELMRRARLFRMRLVVETPDPEPEPLPTAYELAW